MNSLGRLLPWLVCLGCVIPATGEISLMIGNPVAAQSSQVKSSVLVFRAMGCGEQSLQARGSAEGLVDGSRRSVPLAKIAPAGPAGVYAVYREWPAEGVWVIRLTAKCGGESAGAVIPLGPRGFLRESTKHFPRAATDGEVETALKSLDGSR